MPRIVRVIPERAGLCDSADFEMLERHGYFWILLEGGAVKEYDDGDTLRDYRSLATNEEYCWFDHEVEGFEETNHG